MPFGLSNLLALVSDTLRDMLNRFVFIYPDDILMFPRRLLQSQLYVKIEKCKFHVSQVSFLGHIISHIISPAGI